MWAKHRAPPERSSVSDPSGGRLWGNCIKRQILNQNDSTKRYPTLPESKLTLPTLISKHFQDIRLIPHSNNYLILIIIYS